MNTKNQDIETLKKRYEKLNEKRIQAETKLEGARKRLEELQQNAVKEFGTSDLEELAKLLESYKQKNEEKRSQFENQLNEIELNLDKVEAEFNEAS